MVRSNIIGAYVKRQSLGQTPSVFRNAGKPLLFRAYNRKVETCLGTVREEDGVDYLPISGSGAKEDVRDDEDCFDIRDLLLDDETD
jgi:hypothetical protein